MPVVLLWHMHQPQYRDALTGEYVLPWTYLHAIKDYVDMAAHLEAQPNARAVVNFTPVLIEQLQELAEKITEHVKTGSHIPDAVLRLLGPDPVPSAPAERLDLLKACLRAQRKHLIERFGPFLELATIAETLATIDRIPYASDQLIHDLAVWYHLAWMGETVRRSDARVAALTAQGRGFTPQQRRDLLALIGELVADVVPRYRRLSEAGRVELSVTPYGHPIVPLLLDFQTAREAMPGMSLPHHAGYPGGAERAVWHVSEGLRVFTNAFGTQPVGCWPSEGAISAATLELLEKAGFKWIATSANILSTSLRVSGAPNPDDPRSYNRPYSLPGGKLKCFFRDDTLSDRIGFNYSTWHGDDAAQNFAQELAQVARNYNGENGHAILIALDGENAWEYYPFNGYYFLRALYAALADHPLLELITLLIAFSATSKRCRCRRWSQEAGCMALSRRGWATLPRTQRGICCAMRRRRMTALSLKASSTTIRRQRSIISSRCARAQTGSGGSVTTIPPKPCRSSIGSIDASSSICIDCSASRLRRHSTTRSRLAAARPKPVASCGERPQPRSLPD